MPGPAGTATTASRQCCPPHTPPAALQALLLLDLPQLVWLGTLPTQLSLPHLLAILRLNLPLSLFLRTLLSKLSLSLWLEALLSERHLSGGLHPLLLELTLSLHLNTVLLERTLLVAEDKALVQGNKALVCCLDLTSLSRCFWKDEGSQGVRASR